MNYVLQHLKQCSEAKSPEELWLGLLSQTREIGSMGRKSRGRGGDQGPYGKCSVNSLSF